MDVPIVTRDFRRWHAVNISSFFSLEYESAMVAYFLLYFVAKNMV